MSIEWQPGERLTYYPDDKSVCDDHGVKVAEVTSDRAGLFIVASAMFAEWVERNSDLYYEMCAFTRGQKYDEFYRCISRMCALVHVEESHDRV